MEVTLLECSGDGTQVEEPHDAVVATVVAVEGVKSTVGAAKKANSSTPPTTGVSYHCFKVAKKQLRAKKLGTVDHKDDFPQFRPSSAMDWAGVRHHTGTVIADTLQSLGLLDEEAHALVRYEMETLHEVVLAVPELFVDEAIGSITDWMLLLTQQAKVLQNGGQWSATSTAEVKKWGLEEMYTVLERAVSVVPLRLTAPKDPQFTKTAAALSKLLTRAYAQKANREFAPDLRKRNLTEAWIHDDLLKALPPTRVYAAGLVDGAGRAWGDASA